MKILVTGARGQLGRAIQNVYRDEAELILTGHSESEGVVALDISDETAVVKFVKEQNPDIIINCAAYTNVDGCEQDWDGAVRGNAIGPKNLAIAAESVSAKLVHVSTDYVFAGDASKPYLESDTCGPVSAYGRSKLMGEENVAANCSKYFIVRTAWLYGEGKNFVKTMINASKSRDEVSVVCDQVGSPTSTMELARAIRFIAATEEYGIYHATCEGSTNWADFTEEFYKLCEIDTVVNHITSAEYAALNPNAASRPAFSILENKRLHEQGYMMADWHDAIREYLFANEFFKELLRDE